MAVALKLRGKGPQFLNRSRWLPAYSDRALLLPRCLTETKGKPAQVTSAWTLAWGWQGSKLLGVLWGRASNLQPPTKPLANTGSAAYPCSMLEFSLGRRKVR